MDDKSMGNDDRFDSGRGRRPPFGRGGRRPSPGRDRPGGFGYGRDDIPMRDRSPLHGEDRFSDNFKRDDMDLKDSGRSYYGGSDRFMDNRSKPDGPGGFNSRPDPYKSRGMGFPNSGTSAPRVEGFPKPNECEIIAVSKQQRSYAESVEARIKNMGILVDVLFLKDEALLTQTVDDIARRGSLYAMVINPQNQTHGSVTVNILHGTPQEHRNMPLEDALRLVSRNFHEHVRGLRDRMDRERHERGQYTGGVSADSNVQFLLRMLADGRWVSAAEIDTVVRYLSERRDKMDKAKLPEDKLKPKEEIDVAQKEQDLQNKILGLMNQGPAAKAEEPAATPAAETSASTFINFDSSVVQKALDNLMQSGPNLLKSLSGANLNNTSESAGDSIAKTAPEEPMGRPGSLGMGPGKGADMGRGGMGGSDSMSRGGLGADNIGRGGMGGDTMGRGGMGGDTMGRGGMGGDTMGRGGMGADNMGRSGMGADPMSRGGMGGPNSMGRGGMGGMGDSDNMGRGGMGGPDSMNRGGMGGAGNSMGRGGMGNMGGGMNPRGPNMDMNRNPRGPAPGMGGAYNRNMGMSGGSDMGGRGYGSGMSDTMGSGGSFGGPRMSAMGGNFSQNQYGGNQNMGGGFNKGPNQPGGFQGAAGGYNANMMRPPSFGGAQGMGGPRRY